MGKSLDGGNEYGAGKWIDMDPADTSTEIKKPEDLTKKAIIWIMDDIESGPWEDER